jgi:hypothetical protein
LHEEDLFAADRLEELYHHLDVGKPIYDAGANSRAIAAANAGLALPARIVKPLLTVVQNSSAHLGLEMPGTRQRRALHPTTSEAIGSPVESRRV